MVDVPLVDVVALVQAAVAAQEAVAAAEVVEVVVEVVEVVEAAVKCYTLSLNHHLLISYIPAITYHVFIKTVSLYVSMSYMNE